MAEISNTVNNVVAVVFVNMDVIRENAKIVAVQAFVNTVESGEGATYAGTHNNRQPHSRQPHSRFRLGEQR